MLSGGIGSGKSTAAGILGGLGATVVSADAAAHRSLEPEGGAAAAVAARWPEAVVEGRIDRQALGRLVFANPELLAELEAITHPVIRDLVMAEIRGIEAAGPPALVVVEVPLLTEFLGPGWRRLVVDAPDELRIERLRARGMEPGEIAARMAAQPGRSEWLEAADHVIDNGADLAHLASECRRVWAALTGTDPGA
jgi:dephospho-CoA kinase